MSLRVVQQLKQYRRIGNRWYFVFPQEPKRKGICKVIFCRREARIQVRREKNGLRTVRHCICTTCWTRLTRANNPALDAYRVIKDRALRRNQIFKLTFEEFLKEIEGTEYVERRGRGLDELHLDRKQVHLGYVPGNLQVITTAENLRKQHEVDYATVEEPF